MLSTLGVATAQPKTKSTDFVDQDYVLALSTANRFLEAWQGRDVDGALAITSRRVKGCYPAERLATYLSGLSNPHHEAFEIAVDKRLPDGRYAFEVRLYEHYAGEKWREPKKKASRIVLVQAEADEWGRREKWLVDEVPDSELLGPRCK
jgi:hypothetical protein